MTAGIRGKRSGLVRHVFRLLDRRRMPVVILENVSFMLQLEKGSAMNRLTQAFEDRGYRWAYRTLNSLSFLPQRRERVFFVASHCDVDPASVLFADDVAPQTSVTKLRYARARLLLDGRHTRFGLGHGFCTNSQEWLHCWNPLSSCHSHARWSHHQTRHKGR